MFRMRFFFLCFLSFNVSLIASCFIPSMFRCDALTIDLYIAETSNFRAFRPGCHLSIIAQVSAKGYTKACLNEGTLGSVTTRKIMFFGNGIPIDFHPPELLGEGRIHKYIQIMCLFFVFFRTTFFTDQSFLYIE